MSACSQHEVRGGGGVALHVREWGRRDARPIVFVHGWSQSHMCWLEQYDSPLADDFRLVCFDSRGHGQSDKPMRSRAYTQGKPWADDLAAVIDTLRLRRPVLVAWSYGGYIVGDYLSRYGQDRIGGINFVAAATLKNAAGALLGPAFKTLAPLMADPDPHVAIDGTRRFVRACTHRPLAPAVFETVLAFNMLTPAPVRGWMVQRELDFSGALGRLSVPVLVSIGMEDRIVLPAMGEYTLARIAHARASQYELVGHAPFLEAPARFNRELAELVGST
ncbi:MAG: alpha/beta hydrolase [Gammaproteobacteria bacterium]|nr:alpha/beta hydrolase [Gammaproteobacteria bacterium]